MILPNNIIHLLSADPNNGADLITPFEGDHLRGSSYDLTVGEEFYIGQHDAEFTVETQRLRNKQSFTIPPHAVCFILTEEKIHLPMNITARVSLRMTHIYAGMVLTSQPPFDPGYDGKVVVMLYNLSSAPFHLKRGERVATIEFTELKEAALPKKVHRPVKGLEEQLPKPVISSLIEISSVSKAAQDKVTWLSGQMLMFAALVVAVLAVPGFFSYSNLLGQLTSQGEQLKASESKMEAYKRDLDTNRVLTEQLQKRLAVLEPVGSVATQESPSQITNGAGGQ
jgi:deoxycytidine triphosphate deaminase